MKTMNRFLMLVMITVALYVGISTVVMESASAAPLTGPLGQDELGAKILQDPLGLPSGDIRITVARIIRVAMGLLGIIAVVIMLYGGFTWMTAGGEEEKVGEAKKMIFAGIIGLAIILSAYALASFIITKLYEATTAV